MFMPLHIILLCAMLVIAPISFVCALVTGAGLLGAVAAGLSAALQYVLICFVVSVTIHGIALVTEKFYEPVCA